MPGLTVYVGDVERLLDVTEDVLGSAAVVDGGLYSAGAIFLRADASVAIEHEYFHAMQEHLASGHDWGPWWLTEGVAQQGSWLYRDARSETSYADSLAFARWVSTFGDELQSMEDAPDIAFPSAYEFVALAAHWLIARGGPGQSSVIAYYRAAYLPGSQRQWDLREGSAVSGGSDFRLEVPDGKCEISVSVDCGGHPVDLGWHGGESGFTAAYDEVTYVSVDGGDVSGVVIGFPEDPSTYHELCDPRPLRLGAPPSCAWARPSPPSPRGAAKDAP